MRRARARCSGCVTTFCDVTHNSREERVLSHISFLLLANAVLFFLNMA